MKRTLALLLLLVVPTCGGNFAQRDGTFVAEHDLPPIPAWAPTELGPIPITRVADLRCMDLPAYGCFHAHPYSIELRAGMTRAVEWEVLHHEMFHVATYASGHWFADSSVADTLANMVARERMVEMRAGWPR